MSRLLHRALCSIWLDIAHCGIYALISVVAIGDSANFGLGGKIFAAVALMMTVWFICALRERIVKTCQ